MPVVEIPSIVIVGSDKGDEITWTWAWSDQTVVHCWITPADDAARIRTLLAEALPGPGLSDAPTANNDPRLQALVAHGMATTADDTDVELTAGRVNAQARMIHRVLTGPLGSPDAARPWAHEWSSLLLPADVAHDIRHRYQALQHKAPGRHLRCRLMPSASCATLPWELLHLGDDITLLDVADTILAAPIRGRDSLGIRPHEWSNPDERSKPALRLIDPIGAGRPSFVLSAADRATLAGRVAAGETATTIAGERYDRIRLSADLLPDAATPSEECSRRRLLYVGHVSSTDDDARTTALHLGCPRSIHGALPATRRGSRGFSAQDAARGTCGMDPVAEGADLPRVPPAAMSDGHIVPVPGSQLWPMPSRVGLVACQSGGDFSHAEPFGLVTAFLEAGAELITATRWALLTDRAFDIYGAQGSPFLDAAVFVDDLHTRDDPFTGLSQWQRDHARQWQATGDLAHSPLTWAALVNYDGQYRTVSVSTDHPSPAEESS